MPPPPPVFNTKDVYGGVLVEVCFGSRSGHLVGLTRVFVVSSLALTDSGSGIRGHLHCGMSAVLPRAHELPRTSMSVSPACFIV